MPRKPSPPRLWFRRDTGTWIVKDGAKRISTGCGKDDVEAAERALAEYLASKYQAPLGGRAAEITVGDILLVYLEEKSPSTSRPKETEQAIARLNNFMGDRTISEIKGKLCRSYTAHRKTASGARRDLEWLRAALRHYHKEYGLDILPAVTLPEKSTPRERYLTRSEAAALLLACMGWEKVGTGDNSYWQRRKYHRGTHLARLVLIGLYTGTRLGAILDLQWIRNTSGGWVDMDRGVIYRRADGERVAHNKRKTPVRMARKLAFHMERWKRLDGWGNDKIGLRPVVHYEGAAITKPHKAFRSARRAAGLSEDVTPHVLRHTRGTWLAQAGIPPGQAASSLGLTVAEYERTYLHNDPSFQQEAADAY